MKSIKQKAGAVLALAFLASALSVTAKAGEYPPMSEAAIAKLPVVEQKMVPPPGLPEHDQIAKGGFKRIKVSMEIVEKQITIDDKGTKVWVMAYGGSVPGPMIVAHEGDFVEYTLINKATNTLEHNIDFHNSTGYLGGGALTKVQPGEQVTLRFRCTKVGVFVYHCAPGGIMIPWHVTHGMNGAIMILPRKGLKDNKGKSIKYDRAYYIGEQDYYIKKGPGGKYKSYGSVAESMGDDLEVMETLIPSHVVFNGKAGSLLGANAMKAKVGETVLFVHETAIRDTRPHLIGGHGDFVWERGSFNDPPATDLETWIIAGGSAGAFTYKFLQPGVYAYLNHNLIEAVMKGAISHVMVEGEKRDDLMKADRPADTQGH